MCGLKKDMNDSNIWATNYVAMKKKPLSLWLVKNGFGKRHLQFRRLQQYTLKITNASGTSNFDILCRTCGRPCKEHQGMSKPLLVEAC